MKKTWRKSIAMRVGTQRANRYCIWWEYSPRVMVGFILVIILLINGADAIAVNTSPSITVTSFSSTYPIQIISVETLPEDPEVGDILRFNITFQNKADFPVYYYSDINSVSIDITTYDAEIQKKSISLCLSCLIRVDKLSPNGIAYSVAPGPAYGYDFEIIKAGIIFANITVRWGYNESIDNSTSVLSTININPPAPSTVKDYNSLVESLRAEGKTVESAGNISQPFFSITGQAITINGSQVQVFEYQNSSSAEDDVYVLQNNESYASMVKWTAYPHFFKKDRLIVLYIGDDTTIIRALKSLLGKPFVPKGFIIEPAATITFYNTSSWVIVQPTNGNITTTPLATPIPSEAADLKQVKSIPAFEALLFLIALLINVYWIKRT